MLDSLELSMCSYLGGGTFGKVFLRKHTKCVVKVYYLGLNEENISLDAMHEIICLRSIHSQFKNTHNNSLPKILYPLQWGPISCTCEPNKENYSGKELIGRRLFGVEYPYFPETLLEYSRRVGGINSYMFKWITRDIVWTLFVANICGWMHRDIKPLNIMIDSHKEEAILIDWGISSRVSFPRSIKHNTLVQTLPYRAPEICLRCKKYEGEVDIWSLGVSLLESILGVSSIFGIYSSENVMVEYLQTFGNPETVWPEAKKTSGWKPYMKNVGQYQKMRVEDRWPNIRLILNPDGLNLLNEMLCINPKERISPISILYHPFLCGINKLEHCKSIIHEFIHTNKETY